MPPHNGSQGTKDYIADWITPDFFFSKNDSWSRMGMLGVFGDYVLSSAQGAIAEVGCGESSIYLSHLSRKYSRNIYHCDIAADKIVNPLTIAGYMLPDGVELEQPYPKAFKHGKSFFYIGPSDEAFELIKEPLALTFIDGDHCYEQAKKDFINAAVRTVDNGYILLHDTYPPSEEYLCPDTKCGDVYRLRQDIEQMPEFDCLTLNHNVAMGVGLTIVRKKPANLPEYKQ